ncbi:hypothetical protein ACLB2K_049411 [Fragaria x ananassa]
MAKKVVSRYQQDSNFQLLHEQISEVFAECLRSDMECLKKNQRNKISLAAKWCPSLDSSFNKATLLCESIDKKVFPRELYPEYEGLEEAHYAYRVRDRLRKLGKLRTCVAVFDVSRSMDGTPMEVCVSLGLLVSELSEEPWKGKVFDLILQVAVNGNLKPEQMIKRVFVFSDMEFDLASGHRSFEYWGYHNHNAQIREEGKSWETDYEVIQKKFRERGYGDAVPQIVFWNLRDSKSTPVLATQPGVALLSGFSKNALKMFLDDDGQIRPDRIMEKAISGKEYQHLVVVD